MVDTCKECGRFTQQGLSERAEQYKHKPIFGTNLHRPKSEIIREVRQRVLAARNALDDFQFAFPGWLDRTRNVEGLLTCGISVLYDVIAEMEKVEANHTTPNENITGR